MSYNINWLEKLKAKKEMNEISNNSLEIKNEITKITKKKRVLDHMLTEENLILFIKEMERTKPYEMKIRFYNNSANEIQKILDKLFQEKKIKRNRNGWISFVKEV